MFTYQGHDKNFQVPVKGLVLPLIIFLLSLVILELCRQTYWSQWELTLRKATWLNVLLVNISFMGDAWFAAGAILFAFYKKWPSRYFLLVSSCLTIIAIQCMKNMLAGGDWRMYTESCQNIFLYVGQSDDSGLFLPSGFMALFTALGLSFAHRKPVRHRMMIYALPIMAFSRFYLAGQGPAEILLGAMVGSSSVLLSVRLMHWFSRVRQALHKRKFGTKPQGIDGNYFPA